MKYPKIENADAGKARPIVCIVSYTHPKTGEDYIMSLDVDYNMIRCLRGPITPEKVDLVKSDGIGNTYPPVSTYFEAMNSKTCYEKYNGVFDSINNPEGRVIAEESITQYIDENGI